jgi:two-component system response regulator ArlR
MKVLIVEDEIKIGQSLERGLKLEGYETKLVSDGDLAIEEINTFYDLVLLDIMIPNASGYKVAKEIIKINPKTKIIFLTSKSTLDDKLLGFEIGADDYISKPFSFAELIARVKAVLKRENHENIISYKNVLIDLNNIKVLVGENEVNLSKREFELLKFLIQNKSHVFSKEELIEKVWGYNSEILPNTVEVFIKSIRDKIEKPFGIESIIETVRGFGYRVN